MTFTGFPARLEALASERPHAVAISFVGDDVTFEELCRRSTTIASALRDEWNVERGDRVAWIGANDPAQIALLAALMRLSAILVPLNYRLAASELRTMLADSGSTLLVADKAFATTAATLGVPVVDRDELWSSSMKDAAPGQLSATVEAGASTAVGRSSTTPTDPDAPALIVYTSGTTGRPKGAVHTNAMLYANALASDTFHQFRDDDIVLTVLPLFHVGGLCIQTLPALHRGLRVILHPRFDATQWLDSVERERPTLSLMVPATMRAVQEHPRWPHADLSSLRMLGAGSSTIPSSLIARFHARNVPVCQIYGATETGPVSIVLAPEDAYAHAGAAGKPALGVSIRLVDAFGSDAEDGTAGEIVVSGPNVVRSYWNDPHNVAFSDEGFHTGDLAFRDANGFYIVAGRARDLIISGGENIHPAEIENVLVELDGIADVAVVGMPDPRWGEVPVAAIVAREGAALDETSIRAALDARIARFKHPKRIVFRATLPRNALGKVQKQALIDELTQT